MRASIKQKLKEIEENLELIEKNAPAHEEEFIKLGIVKDGIYKRLEFSIQNLIDIFTMVYSSQNIGVPTELDDIFSGLSKKKVFPQKVISIVQKMKGLRNILIHKYGEIDDHKVFELVSEHLTDFSMVIDEIDQYLEK